MVDTAFRKAVRVEVVERAVDSIAEAGLLVRVAQHPFAHKSIIRLVGLVDIEVSRQDGRAAKKEELTAARPFLSIVGTNFCRIPSYSILLSYSAPLT